MKFSKRFWLSVFAKLRFAATLLLLTYSLTHLLHSAPWWDLRFCDGDSGFEDPSAIENMLESYILSASSMVYLANFSVPSSDNKITSSMNNRDTAGLDVKYVGEGNNGNYTGLQAGIPYNLDPTVPSSIYMHNKFLIIDPNGSKKRLVTGSGNYTPGGWGSQDNAWLTITDSTIINKYLAEFNELFGGTFHGGTATSNPVTTSNGITVHTLFSSEDQPWLVGNIVDKTIRAATESVFFETTGHDPSNSGTLDFDEAIWSVLDDAGKPNFFVEGVVNEIGGGFTGTALSNYNSKGGYIRQSAVTGWDKHHHKYVVVDMDWLGVGSVNASKSSSEYSGVAGNDENHIFINDFRLARAFMKEFSRHYKLDATYGSVDNTSVTEPHDWVAPAAPTGLSVAPTATSFNVSWTAPANPGDFSRYYIFISTNNNIATAKSEITESDGSFRASFLRPEMQKKGLATTSAALTTYNEGDALVIGKDYYIGVVSVDKYGNESAAVTGGPYQLQLSKTIDGSDADWTGTPPSEVNRGVISANEWIWKDKISDERVDGGTSGTPPEDSVDKNYDITEFRVSADANNVYFLVRYQDITALDEPYISISIDSDQSGSDTATNWNGDDSGTLLGGDYNLTAAAKYAERQIIVHRANADAGAKIELYAEAGNWYAPSSGNGYNNVNVTDNFIEFGIARTDLLLDGAKTARISVAAFDNGTTANPGSYAWANDDDTTVDYPTIDALDTLSISSYTSNDNTYQKTAWEEDISDGDIDFFADIRIAANGTISNNPPATVTTPSPANNGTTTSTTPTLTWAASSDSDAGDAVTSYLLEFNSTSALDGNVMYRLNLTGTSYTIPSALTNGQSYYWRVSARDRCGTLSGPTTWKFTVALPNTAPTAPTVTAPNGGEKWKALSTTHTITWTAATDAEGDTLTYQIDYSSNNGTNWTSVASGLTGTSYNWTVPNTPSANCLVRIRAYDGALYGGYDQSNAVFTIWIDAAPPAADHLVISQIRISSNASTNADFVELYNPTDNAIDLNALPLKLHYYNTTPTDSNIPLTFVRNTIPSQGFFLLTNVSYTGGDLPTGGADATYTAGNYLRANYCVYLSTTVTTYAALPSIKIDAVGMGTNPRYETKATTSPAPGKTVERKPGSPDGNGTDTDNNVLDFMYPVTSHPRNSQSATEPAAGPNLAPSTPTVTVPNGGESWTVGTTYYITWAASTDPEGKSVTYQIDYSANNGSAWTSVTTSTSGTTYQWVVPDTPSTNCLVRIRAYDGVNYSGYDQSNSTFTIVSAPVPPTTNQPPTQPTDGTPSDIITWVNDNTPTFTWKFNDPDVGDLQSAYRWQTDDDAGFESINYDTGKKLNSANSHIPSSPLADGFWYWRVMVWDVAESSSPWSQLWAIKIDATPPEYIDDLTATLSGNDVVLTWSEPNADISGLKNYRIYRYTEPIDDSNRGFATKFADDNVTGFTDTSANSGTKYYYAVTTLDNATNESALSNNAEVTTPGTVVRSVVINELAIKGTNASDTDEWIELYNPSEYDIDLSGWSVWIGTTTEISLSTSPVIIIPAGGYVLLERTDDNVVIGSTYTADKIYTGTLTDDGATVKLKDKNGNIIDSVSYLNGSGGWPTLNATTDQTLERKDAGTSGSEPSNWALNDMITKNGLDAGGVAINGTPKNQNSCYAIKLLNWSVTPATGTVSQSYKYQVLYKNSNNTAPDTKQLIIDGGAIVGNMTSLGGTDYQVAGVSFTFTTTLSTGVHNYYFYFTAGAYTKFAPSNAPDETFTGPWVGSDLTMVSMYGSGSTNPNPTTNPEDNASVQLPQNGKQTLYAYLKPGGENGWTVYGATITYWTTTIATKTATMKYLGSEDGKAKFYVSLSSGVDFKAGEYFYYYVRARDTNTATPFKFTDDAGDTNADRWVSSADTNNNTVNFYHYFKFGTASGGENTFEYKMVKRNESSADWTIDAGWNNGNNWTATWRSSGSVENLPDNKVYNSEDVGVGVSVSPGGTVAACTFYYTINNSSPTTAAWKFSSAQSNNFNKTTVNGISDFKLFLPADINSAGTTIYVGAAITDNAGVVYNIPPDYKYIFKYGVTATPGEPVGDKTAIVLGRGNRDGKYPTTDFGNYSPLRHLQDEIIKTGDVTRYLMPSTTDNLQLNSSFLTTTGSDSFLDYFYADPVKFYLRTAFRDSADADGLGTFSEASLVWRTVGSTDWSEELMQVNSAGSDDQNPYHLSYHWLATSDNTALQGNPPDCTKGVPEGATVRYIFKVRDNQSTSSGDFRWIYRDSTTKRQRLTDSASTAKAENNQFEYKVLQDDYTRPVAYMPENIPGVTTKSQMTAPSWPAVVLGDTVTICGSTVETVKVYIGLFDTADGRFIYGDISSTECVANPNYQHRTYADPNITNANYFGNNVIATNTITNTANSGIKGGRAADSHSELLEGYNSEGRRVTHDVLCYYVWRRCGANNGSMVEKFSWIDRDGTINNNPKDDSTGTDVIAESGTDLVNQMIRIENVDGATEHYYTTPESSAATKGWISGRVSMAPYNTDPDTGNGIWVAEIPAPADMDLQIATSAVSFLYYRIWACNGDNDPQAYNTEIHGGSLMSGGLPSSPSQCQPHEETQAQFGTQTLNPFGKSYVNVGSGGTACPCGRVHDRDYGWVDITRYGGRITSPPRVMIKSKVTVGGVTRTITTYLKVDPTTRRPTNIISTQVGSE
ncbi:MAG: lamin tail domain-containing protein [Elusimicrobia bacterium]|nr:lamin tail domain-containing protein [Elusimicrobiota bacterium]